MFLQLLQRWFCVSVSFFPLPSFFPHFSSLIVALESFHHEQLPQILRGKFLHVLAVIVDLPCWRAATCIHAPPQQNIGTHTRTKTYICTYICRQPGGGGGRENKLVVSRVNIRVQMLSVGGGELNSLINWEKKGGGGLGKSQ